MKKLLFLLCGAFLWTACGNPEGSSHTSKDDERISKCFREKDYKYEDLLTKFDIAKHVIIDEDSYKMKISPAKGKYGSCTYEWLSDRPDLVIEILGQVGKSPDKNRVEIKMLDFYEDGDLKLYKQVDAQAAFDRVYKKINQAEYDGMLADLKKSYADNPGGFDQAKGFLDVRMTLKFEPINNLGDRAYWKWHDTHGIELVVLTGAAQFTIASKTNGDPNTALGHAVKFAEEVLAKCAG